MLPMPRLDPFGVAAANASSPADYMVVLQQSGDLTIDDTIPQSVSWGPVILRNLLICQLSLAFPPAILDADMILNDFYYQDS